MFVPMGYDAHITRAASWVDSAQSPITLQEWLALVASDPELRHDGVASATTRDGDGIEVRAPGLVVWTGWSQHGRDGAMAWIQHGDGELVVKNPDEELLRKLHRIATALGARVQGDDGEEYDADGNVIA
jgi:hypothetical protein